MCTKKKEGKKEKSGRRAGDASGKRHYQVHGEKTYAEYRRKTVQVHRGRNTKGNQLGFKYIGENHAEASSKGGVVHGDRYALKKRKKSQNYGDELGTQVVKNGCAEKETEKYHMVIRAEG